MYERINQNSFAQFIKTRIRVFWNNGTYNVGRNKAKRERRALAKSW